MNILVITLAVLCVGRLSAIPILSNDDTRLDSIFISEIIDLPTEPSLVVIDQEISREPESSFHELIERYDEAYIKSGEDVNIHKRLAIRSDDAEEDLESVGGGKSIIEKVLIPDDPDVRNEFLNELLPNSVAETASEDVTELPELATDYDPNYSRKMIVVNETRATEDVAKLTVHEKENLQAHLVEQLVHQSDSDNAFTTIVSDESFSRREVITNPEVVEVMEHIVYETDNELKSHEHTTLNPIVAVKLDIDPIEIIPKDRHRLGRDDNSTELNDKFAGFVGIPSEDLTQPGDETTEPDSFFKKNEEQEEESGVVDTLRETLEYVAIYGKSLEVDIDAPTTLAPVTEIVEVNTQISINVQAGGEIESGRSSSSSEEASSQQSLSHKSSEEEVEVDKRRGSVKSHSAGDGDSSSEENSGREHFDNDLKSDLRSLVIQRPNSLPEDVFKSAEPCHEIKKKDHPPAPPMPLEIAVVADRKLDTEVAADEPAAESPLVETMTALYDTFEEITTTVSDGLKLTNELKQSVESFRAASEENKIVLDTHREAISSKNSKVPLVGVNEMMTLRDYSMEDDNVKEHKTELALAVIPYIAIASALILLGLFKLVKKNASAVAFY